MTPARSDSLKAVIAALAHRVAVSAATAPCYDAHATAAAPGSGRPRRIRELPCCRAPRRSRPAVRVRTTAVTPAPFFVNLAGPLRLPLAMRPTASERLSCRKIRPGSRARVVVQEMLATRRRDGANDVVLAHHRVHQQKVRIARLM